MNELPWIPVTERLPAAGDVVLTRTARSYQVAEFGRPPSHDKRDIMCWLYEEQYEDAATSLVTHWLELPKLPPC